jgi:hypothetical protein
MKAVDEQPAMQAANGGGTFPRFRDALVRRLLGLSAVVIVLSPAGWVAAAGHEFKIRRGPYALCAASTCTSTGGDITVHVTAGGTAQFPEYDCTCPILEGPAIADLAGGNMQGSCQPPSENQVWSIFAPREHIPQAINHWARFGPLSAAPPLLCPANLNLGDQLVNCFSFACDSAGRIGSVPVATCHCALGESPDGTPVAANTTFLTQAGQGHIKFCDKHPVAGALP